MQTVNCNYLLVGQGLAGSSLAMELLFRGKSVRVIDQPSLNRSSLVAAGLFNPITGRRPALTWRAKEIFDLLEVFYPRVEQVTDRRFFYPTPLYRPFVNEQERAEWVETAGGAEMRSFVRRVYTEPSGEVGVRDPLGGLLLDRCGFVDVPAFLGSVRTHLQKKGSFEEARFEFEQLQWSGSVWEYDQLSIEVVILCQGIHAVEESPAHLPIHLLKGQTLTIVPSQTPRWLYNRGVYVVPVPGTGDYKVGATYNRDDTAESITSEGRLQLMEKAGELLSMPWKVVGQDWGLRPTSPDRRPMLGRLPGFENLFVLNGLGTKGVSLAPYTAKLLADHLIDGLPIDKVIALSRYY